MNGDWKGLLVVVVGWECFHWRGSVPMWKGLTLEGEIVGNPTVSLSPTLDRNEKIEQYIKVKDPLTHCLKVLEKCRSPLGRPFWALEHQMHEVWASSLRLGRRRVSLTAQVPFFGRLSAGSTNLGRHLEDLSVKDHRSPPGRPMWDA
ncbi:hypothetical protein LR48_Vigan03g132100 [Vigna angularis]|uniref:Uncharacterized protein n=1 Tax=Phaseolus angularis TaxID=3914 RepID=A0A0L9U6B3_PHAAN|nr:hypothetical protein LR48_Vigan03g132100 [Vigna angularis]